jgi:hypothetical protein
MRLGGSHPATIHCFSDEFGLCRADNMGCGSGLREDDQGGDAHVRMGL